MMTQQRPFPGSWRLAASCRGHNPEWWYAEPGSPDTARALRICQECPVKDACLAYAVTNAEHHGVWGGTRPRTRTKMINALYGRTRRFAKRPVAKTTAVAS